MFHVKHFVLGRLYDLALIKSGLASDTKMDKLFHVKQFGCSESTELPFGGIGYLGRSSPIGLHDRIGFARRLITSPQLRA